MNPIETLKDAYNATFDAADAFIDDTHDAATEVKDDLIQNAKDNIDEISDYTTDLFDEKLDDAKLAVRGGAAAYGGEYSDEIVEAGDSAIDTFEDVVKTVGGRVNDAGKAGYDALGRSAQADFDETALDAKNKVGVAKLATTPLPDPDDLKVGEPYVLALGADASAYNKYGGGGGASATLNITKISDDTFEVALKGDVGVEAGVGKEFSGYGVKLAAFMKVGGETKLVGDADAVRDLLALEMSPGEFTTRFKKVDVTPVFTPGVKVSKENVGLKVAMPHFSTFHFEDDQLEAISIGNKGQARATLGSKVVVDTPDVFRTDRPSELTNGVDAQMGLRFDRSGDIAHISKGSVFTEVAGSKLETKIDIEISKAGIAIEGDAITTDRNGDFMEFDGGPVDFKKGTKTVEAYNLFTVDSRI